MINAVISILIGTVIAAVSLWITVQLSLRRFRSEKWRERKTEAYERIIEALHHSKAFADAHLEAGYEGRDVSDQRDKLLRERSRQAHLEIEKAADIGAFILSDEAQERLKRYHAEAKDATNAPHWDTFLEGCLSATDPCL